MTHLRQRLVVIGHGMVGHHFVQAAIERGLTERWDVVVFAQEPRAAYNRVALTSFFDVGADELSLLPQGRYDDPRVRLILDNAVTAIDRVAGTVTAVSGEVVPYDALVIATGSVPFVPPLPGRDLVGCFVYRTIEDLEAIREAAAKATTGVVIGGGLLGLEAANAVQQLGLQTHVVEMAPRLMPVQLDQGGGAALVRRIEGLGVTVHTDVRTEAIEGVDGQVTSLAIADGEPIATDLVVFSVGIRAQDALARDCGLTVAERGGILVDEACCTSDKAIYAIGECAAPAGKTYGLLAPGYVMAEVVVDRLLGGAGGFTGADMSTKLKLMGVDVASFGDAFATTPGSLELVFADAVAGVYKKLVVSSDATRLLGGILVGDASAYGVLRPMVSSGICLPENPEELILPLRSTAKVGMTDQTVVCSCQNVTKGTICSAIDGAQDTAGCADLGCLKSCTKAGTVCGSCVPTVKNLLAERLASAGREVSNALCEHFAMSRQELFDLVAVKQIRSFTTLVAGHGTGRGCDICKPAVASILASQTSAHVLDEGTVALQDTNDAFLGNIQRNGTYSVVPRVPGGELTPDGLIAIGEVARDFALYTKITGGQRIDLFGARVEQLPLIWRRLVDAGFESGHAYGKSLRTVKSCVGSTWCRFGVQDAVGLAIAIEERYKGIRSPHKLKFAVSGCARECAEAQGKDVGVIATEKGWNLFVCGNGGMKPRHAELLVQDLSEAEVLRVVDRFLVYYIRTADRLTRTSVWLDEIGGIEHVRDVVLNDSLGINALLEAQMEDLVKGFQCEWKTALENPDILHRFKAFANDPRPNPAICFSVERGQRIPA